MFGLWYGGGADLTALSVFLFLLCDDDIINFVGSTHGFLLNR